MPNYPTFFPMFHDTHAISVKKQFLIRWTYGSQSIGNVYALLVFWKPSNAVKNKLCL